MGRLTVKGIPRLPAGRHGDGNTLHLVVQPTGSRSWIQRLTVGGRRLDRGLGPWPAVSLAQARELAFRNRVTARTGGDPFTGPTSRIPTFRAAAAKVADADRARLAERSARANAAALERYALPGLGDRRVDQIGRADVLGVLSPIWTTTPAIAKKVRGLIRAVMAWAQAHGHVEHNVVDAVGGALPAMPTVKEHMRAMAYQDVGDALKKIDECRASASARSALRFLVLTAARTVEVRGARWSEIDEDGRTWTIPAERMKARREHRAPLSGPAMAVLESVRPLRRSNDLVFPSPTAAGMLATVTLNNAMRSAGLGDRGTPHGFRSAFRTWASEQTDADYAVCEMALAHHVGNSVERAYARSTLFAKRRELMEQWSTYVTQA